MSSSLPTDGLSKEEQRLQAKRAAGPWLNAWHDTVANIKAFSPCVRLADLNATGEYLLLIADADKKLKVYKGTSLASEHALLDVPSALATFYTDLNKPQTPSVAVAAGSYIFIYRNLRPYYKFTLPPVDIEQVEQDVWAGLRASKLDNVAALEQLSEARDTGVQLSTRSMNLLGLATRPEQDAFINSQKSLPLVQLTVATCMETLNKNMTTERAISSLVVGTESRHIIIMDPSGTSILKKFLLPSVPVFLAVQGTFDVEYRIVIAARNGNIYQIKKGKVSHETHTRTLDSFPLAHKSCPAPCTLTFVSRSVSSGSRYGDRARDSAVWSGAAREVSSGRLHGSDHPFVPLQRQEELLALLAGCHLQHGAAQTGADQEPARTDRVVGEWRDQTV
jgi:hypothetical protein